MFILLVLTVCCLTWSNGANDTFKGVASLYGSGATGYRTALAWGTLSTAAGSAAAILLAAGLLGKFSGKGLVPDALAVRPEFLVSVALAAGATVLLATRFGFPISTTHALTGAMVGSGWMAGGTAVKLGVLGKGFLLPLLLSLVLAVVVGSVIYLALKRKSLAFAPIPHQFPGVKTLLASALGMIAACSFGWAAPVQVTALHPLMADLARQVGGNRVQVFDLVGEGGNPHRFEPRPADLRKMQSSALILAGGKGLESYLDRIQGALGSDKVVEVGRTIPSLTVGKDAVYTCCPHHGGGSLDPHWWHGIENMRRASRVVAQALAERDPSGKDTYMANASAYSTRLADLKKWAKGELGKVPRGQRKLVTAHNAFGYFAKEFGFEVIAVAGLNKEQNTTPQEQAKTIDSVRKAGVRAVFPEFGTSAKAVKAIAAATGTAVATPLISDGNGTGKEAGFEGMMRHNVNAITNALAKP